MAVAGPINFVAGNLGMQIDFPNNINPNIADNNAVTGQKADPAKTTADVDSVLTADYSSIISRAIADSERVDVNLIADAKLSIDSGRLDTPEAIASTAENILKLGI
jgi:hypothetical protein